MADKAYEYMDWPRIEGLVYGEEAYPRELLGARVVKRNQILIQCYFPNAKAVKVHVKDTDKNYKMTLEDEAGYYAAVIPGKSIPDYEYVVENQDKTTCICGDPYIFESMLSPREEKAFCEGVDYHINHKLGAHPMRRNGVRGVYFAIWAPNALRVSVVGDFNAWDPRVHPMHKSGLSGIYELFVPAAKPGDLYKYEIMVKGGATFLRTDPYAMEREVYPQNASRVPDTRKFSWKDEEWMKTRKDRTGLDKPLSIGEIRLSDWGDHYREMADKLADYAGKRGYTHLEISPVMEYGSEEAGCYGTTGYFAVDSRYGTPADFKYLVEKLHSLDVGVIMDWTAAHFPAVEEGMARLDGTCLYEPEDIRRKQHPFWGTLLFHYESPMVREFLISNSLYWLNEFHLDGLRLDDVDAMLYLDYGRRDGEWTPNIYGGNENLAAVEFIKQLSSTMKKQAPGTLLIAQEDGLWPSLTGEADETHVGFDYKWNNGWTGTFLNYLRHTGDYRRMNHDELTAGMLYAYCENYILTFNRRDIGDVQQLMDSLPEQEAEKLSTVKAALGYFMTHPGKKMLAADPQLSEHLQLYLQELLKLYKETPALYAMDCEPEGFEWLQLMENEKSILTFLRRTAKPEDTVLVVCNFSNAAYDKHIIGVPSPGKYKEIFNSDQKRFGGTGFINPRVKTSRKVTCDERKDSITVKVPPMSVSIYAYRG